MSTRDTSWYARFRLLLSFCTLTNFRIQLGRTGDPPDRLRHLLDTATDFDDEVEKLANGSGGVGGIEAGMDTEAKHFLFMVSYPRLVSHVFCR